MIIKWKNIESEVPPLNEKVLTVDVNFPDDGFEWEERIGDRDWSKSYSITHWARLDIKDIAPEF